VTVVHHRAKSSVHPAAVAVPVPILVAHERLFFFFGDTRVLNSGP
jgi:hypothetical protein